MPKMQRYININNHDSELVTSNFAQTLIDTGTTEDEWMLMDEWELTLSSVNSVTPRQARLALLEMQLLDAVEAAIVAGPQEWQIEWEYATSVQRDSNLVQGLGPALGLTDADLDALFALAASK